MIAGADRSVALRPAELRDVPRLLSMMAEFNVGEEIAVDPDRLRPALARLLEDGELGRAWIITRGQVEVGYAVLTFGYDLEFAGRDAFLTELYLVGPARGAGIGRLALAAIEAEAARMGVQAIHLMVRPQNAPAVALYRSAGYRSPPRVLLSKIIGP